jgi:hypothetical protein
MLIVTSVAVPLPRLSIVIRARYSALGGRISEGVSLRTVPEAKSFGSFVAAWKLANETSRETRLIKTARFSLVTCRGFDLAIVRFSDSVSILTGISDGDFRMWGSRSGLMDAA